MQTDSRGPTILLVEDDEDDQEFIMTAFSKITTGHRFILAGNGREALDIVSDLEGNQLPSLIIMDLNMPVLDGEQTLRALSGQLKYQHIPKVIYTTSDSLEHRQRCLRDGATDYLVKSPELAKTIGNAARMLHYCQK